MTAAKGTLNSSNIPLVRRLRHILSEWEHIVGGELVSLGTEEKEGEGE